MGPSLANTVDDLTYRLDFEPKIDEQLARCDSAHCRATDSMPLDRDIRVEYDGFWPLDASKLEYNMRQ